MISNNSLLLYVSPDGNDAWSLAALAGGEVIAEEVL